MELRDYQTDAVRDIYQHWRNGDRCVLLAASTGSGKTVIATKIISDCVSRGKRALFVVDRKKLLNQAADHLRKLGLKVGVLQGSNTDLRQSDQVVVCTIQSLKSRGYQGDVALVVIDEAHILHAAHIELIKAWDAVKFLGLSATPLRLGLGLVFDSMVRAPSIGRLIAHGHLVDVEVFGPTVGDVLAATAGVAMSGDDYSPSQLAKAMNSRTLIGDIVTTWLELGQGAQTLCFCSGVAHSQEVAKAFRDAGVPALHLDGSSEDSERQEAFADFEAGRIRVLCSADLLTTGCDFPFVSCLIIARPTHSLSLHLQIVGRGLRSFAGKLVCRVLDHSANFLRHCGPADFVVPDLDCTPLCEKLPKPIEPVEVKDYPCAQCGYLMPLDDDCCSACGAERNRRKIARVVWHRGKLKLLALKDLKPTEYNERERLEFYRMLLWIAQEKGYKSAWCYHKYVDYFKDKPPWSWQQAKPLEPSALVSNWVRGQQRRYAYQRNCLN